MWSVSDKTELQMAEGDYGIALPIKISGMELTSSDCVRLTIKTALNGDTILTKEFTNIENNTISLEFTEEESALLPIKRYVYRLDVYQDGNFLNNIVPCGTLKVVDVA